MDSNEIQALDSGAYPDAPLSWEQIARALYDLLDDCDTADDIAKSNDDWFRRLVRNAHRQRFRYGTPDLSGIRVDFNVK